MNTLLINTSTVIQNISKITLFIENHIFANIILSTQNVFDSLLNNKIQGQSLE